MPIASLAKPELFERLAAGAAVTVVTPNVRLAQELGREFDAWQVAREHELWDAPDLLPLSAYLTRAYEEALYANDAPELALLLEPAEEQALWEEIVAHEEKDDPLLAIAQAAASARDAWKTAHAWRLLEKARRYPLNEDAEAFLRWAQRYERATREAGQTDRARLPDLVASIAAGPAFAKPELLVRYGFDLETAQQHAFFETLASHGVPLADCAPARQAAAVVRLPCIDARDEIRRAARWARERLERAEDKRVRIGVVVPDLEKRRGAIRRVFAQTFGTEGRAVQPFNVSLGTPLADYPLVHAAFLVFELAGREIDFERASQAIRSPFIGEAQGELAARARLDAAVRRRAEPTLTLERLLGAVRAGNVRAIAPALVQRLEALAEFRKSRLFGPQSPVEWGRAFSDALKVVGFPGERALDSTEYQTLKKWHEVLAQFAQLERVTSRMRYAEAVARLARIASDTAFQPEVPDVPVQVLGVLESAGCEFDHLWVMGLSAEVWPLAARPTPFLPIALQREAGVPEASAESSLALDRRITQGWQAAAAEVVFSHPLREGDRELDPSPLIAGIAQGTLETTAYATMRDALAGSADLEPANDPSVPMAIALDVRGGSGVIEDQAACPFRAFSIHRLGTEGLEAPHAGLDALERGTLVHQVLAAAWTELKDKASLDAMPLGDLEEMLGAAAEAAIARKRRERPSTLGGRFAAIERQRLVKLALDWLEQERAREPFTVVATEAKRAIEVGGLRLNARLDRVDETADGRRVVIDYKSGKGRAADWFGERPDAPQLPLYLTSAEPDARAIAFAQVRTREMKWIALAADPGLLPGALVLPIKRYGQAAENWEAQVAAWRVELARLAKAFAAGEAPVDPKPKACEYCDQALFCRINERGDDRNKRSGDTDDEA